jgi:hypothetical protein
MTGYSARLALLLHLLDWAVEDEETISLNIPASTMARAIALTHYYIGQIQLIRGTTLADDSPEQALPAKLKKLIDFARVTRSMTTSDVSRKRWGTAAQAKEMFCQLESMGYGRVETSIKGNRESVAWHYAPDDAPETIPVQNCPDEIDPLLAAPVPLTTHTERARAYYSPKIGDKVCKRHKIGWSGEVVGFDLKSGYADVTWLHDLSSEKIRIRELKALEEISKLPA